MLEAVFISLQITFAVTVSMHLRVPEKPSPVHFGSKLLTIPRTYFEYEDRKSDLDWSDEIYLRVYMPDYTPVPTRPETVEGVNRDRISLRLLAKARSLNRLYVRRAQERDEAPVEEAYGLHMFHTVRRSSFSGGDEVLFGYRDGVVTTLIECTPGAPNPLCVQTFRDADYLYTVRYEMRFLPSWQNTENKLRAIVAGFAVP